MRLYILDLSKIFFLAISYYNIFAILMYIETPQLVALTALPGNTFFLILSLQIYPASM